MYDVGGWVGLWQCAGVESVGTMVTATIDEQLNASDVVNLSNQAQMSKLLQLF